MIYFILFWEESNSMCNRSIASGNWWWEALAGGMRKVIGAQEQWAHPSYDYSYKGGYYDYGNGWSTYTWSHSPDLTYLYNSFTLPAAL